MATAVILPRLDEVMTSGKIARWLKKEGDQVQKGEGLVEIETEKVTFEVEATDSGLLSKLMAIEGQDVPVGTLIAYILKPGEKAPEGGQPVAVAASAEKKPEAAVKEAVAAVPAMPNETMAGVRASPLAKKIAIDQNIDISSLKGTGPDGRIVKDDVLRAVEQRKVAPVPAFTPAPARAEAAVPVGPMEEVAQLSGMRKIIARRMIESFQTPHFYLTVEVDMQEMTKTVNQLRPVIEKKSGVRLTITDVLIKMAGKALEDNPAINVAYVGDTYKIFKNIDIGLVTSVEGGLIVPVIRAANKKSLTEIARVKTELVQKAREGKLSLADMKGSTFTISNLGMFGIDQFSAILQPPEASILALGRSVDKPVVRDSQIVIRPMMNMTLSIDHRILDGALGAAFLQSLKNYIENPVSLIM